MIPFLFITIACGAISGFHCLVSSGTTSKQLKCETDAQMVGYGSMLVEGFLAVIVILACVAGIGLGSSGANGELLTGSAAWASRYADWPTASNGALGAFVRGASNFLRAIGLSTAAGTALVASFAADPRAGERWSIASAGQGGFILWPSSAPSTNSSAASPSSPSPPWPSKSG